MPALKIHPLRISSLLSNGFLAIILNSRYKSLSIVLTLLFIGYFSTDETKVKFRDYEKVEKRCKIVGRKIVLALPLAEGSSLAAVLELQRKIEGETIFHELMANIKALPEDFMEGPNFKKNVTCEEERYFWRLRIGSFDLETLRARKRMATWVRTPRFARGNVAAGLESFFEASSDNPVGDIYYEVLRIMGHPLWKECQETKSVNEEYAKHLEQRGKVHEAKRIRKRL